MHIREAYVANLWHRAVLLFVLFWYRTGRPQGCAPTIHDQVLSCIVGAHPCGRPVLYLVVVHSVRAVAHSVCVLVRSIRDCDILYSVAGISMSSMLQNFGALTT